MSDFNLASNGFPCPLQVFSTPMTESAIRIDSIEDLKDTYNKVSWTDTNIHPVLTRDKETLYAALLNFCQSKVFYVHYFKDREKYLDKTRQELPAKTKPFYAP